MSQTRSIPSCPACGSVLSPGVRPEFCPVCLLGLARSGREEPGPTGEGRRIGDYELLGEVARGGMGVVYRARQLGLGRVVAVKLLLGGQFAGPEDRIRFQREATAAARLQHPHLVAIHEIGEHEGQPFFSMEYIDGPTLADRVRSGPLAPGEAARLALGIALVVDYAHREGVLHRDLKPSNVLIDPFGQPRVTDFGLAKHLHGSGTLTRTGEVLGSPAYAAPEVVRGVREEVGVAADVYSLGALLYHLLTGRPPFLADTVPAVLRQVSEDEPVSPRRLNPSVPADLETVCLRCLEKEPARRYASAGEVADELRRFLAGDPVLARPVGWVGRTWRRARRRPRVALLAGALLAVSGCLVVLAVAATVRIVRAEARAVRSLRETLLVQARALRLAGGPGQQVASLAAVDEALRLGDRRAPDERAGREIVAALAQADLRFSPASHGVWQPGRLHPLATGRVWRQLEADGTLRDFPLVQPGSGREWPQLAPEGIALGAATPSGGIQAVVESNGLSVWDLAGASPRRLRRLAPVPLHHAISPDGRWLVTAGESSESVWDDLTSGVSEVVGLGEPGIRGLVFSPGGRQLAVPRMGTNAVDVYAMPARELEVRLMQPGPPARVAWSPDGSRFVVATTDGRLFYQDVATRNRILSFTFAPAQPLGLAWDASGRRLASAWDDRTVRLWDLHGGRLWVAAPGDAGALGFLPDGSAFGPVARQGQTGWYGVVEPVGFREILAGNLGTSELDVAFSSDSRWVAGRYQMGVRVFEIAGGGLPLALPVEFPRSMAQAGSMSRVAVVDRNGVACWDLGEMSGPGSRRLLRSGPGWVAVAARFDAEGWWLLDAKGELVRLDADGGGMSGSGWGRHAGADGLVPDPAGRWLVSIGSASGELRVWDAVRGGEVHRLLVGGRPGARFSPDGRRLAAWGAGFQLLETGRWEPLAVPGAGSRPVLGAAAFSPDSRRLAVAADVYEILLLDLAEGRELLRIEPPSPLRIHALAWSPDGARLAAATAQGKIRLWHLPVLEGELRRRGLGGWN